MKKSLDRAGRHALEQRDYARARRLFSYLFKTDDNPVIRNNLALAIHMEGDDREALSLLAPNIDPTAPPNPYSHALAVRILKTMGEVSEARGQLNEAIADFEAGLFAAQASPQAHRIWGEYTVAIMRAAGELSDHRLAYELYRRWEQRHTSWESRYLAGVAAFNLRKYSQAGRLWSAVAGLEPVYEDMLVVIDLIDRGTIPPFSLEYEFIYSESMLDALEELAVSPGAVRLLTSGNIKMLGILIRQSAMKDGSSVQAGIEVLVVGAGEWGRGLGRGLLEGTRVSMPAKIGAALGLVHIGEYEPGQPIEMVVDGERQLVSFKPRLIDHPISEAGQDATDRAIDLAGEGDVAQAIDLLESLLARESNPQVSALLAGLYTVGGRLDASRRLLVHLNSTFEGDPLIQLNMTALELRCRNANAAKELISRINPDELTPDGRRALDGLMRDLALLELQGQLRVTGIEDLWRGWVDVDQLERKPLPLNPTISRGLKNLPSEWLDATLVRLGLERSRMRKQRERQIVEHLSDAAVVRELVSDLNREERELISYVMSRGGWARVNVVYRMFGSMDDDFHSPDVPPASPLGRLWLMGLVFVGQAIINNRRCRIVAVPVEVRESLSALSNRRRVR